MAVYTVSIGDGSTLSSLAVSAGRGPKGDGWTGVSYDPQTGKFTFTSNDGLGYVSDDITVDLDAAVAAAQAAQTSAEAAETNTINLFDQFGDQYLGPKASDPATDNDGDPLTDGDIYFNTTDNVLKFYSGTAWVAPEVIATTAANDAQTAQAAAETSETNAANSASAAATSETNAATSETNAATSETNAANSASAAATSESNAATSETNAANSASAAATSEANAAASFDSFDDRYLGSKSSAPTLDNDGDALLEGALYWNSTSDQLFIWDGSAWSSASFSDANPSFDSITATEGTFSRLTIGANLEWNASTDTYTANTTPTTVTKIHQGMKRCVLNDDGSVNYYLDPTDSTKKLDGTAANIDGTDGNVMVEIPKFYFRQVRDGSTLEWQVSDVPLAGYQLHPAFFKNGEIVDFRYIGAYDACVYDDSAGTYLAGLNLDDNTGNIDTANDKLASVSGIYPMVGVARDECRSLAANNGTGWRQQDFWLTCAVQMLYLVEFGDFNSQANLGDGNTNGGYIAGSADQNDSPHTIAGASNSFGNASTDGTQPSAGAKPGTAYMSYRGIENFFGNCWNWVDGVNIGSGVQGDWHASNDDGDFADNTTTNYEFLVNSMPADGYVTDIADVVGAFIPSATGGSSSTYLSDFFFDDNGNTNRVARFGGSASNGALAGAFVWVVSFSSGVAFRQFGARLSR